MHSLATNIKNIIDLDETIRIIGTADDTEQVLALFIESLPLTKQEFELAFIDYNVEQLRALCHKLKGSTAYCITPNLTNQLTIFHELLRNSSEDQQSIQYAYLQLVASLDELAQTLSMLSIPKKIS